MPRRPEFPWMQLVYALSGVSIFGFFFMDWLFSQNMAEIDFMHLLSLDGVTAFFSATSSGTWATILGLAAAAMLVLPDKLKLLSRTVLSS